MRLFFEKKRGYFFIKNSKSLYMFDLLSAENLPTTPQRCGSLTKNVKNITHIKLKDGVTRRAQRQSPKASETVEDNTKDRPLPIGIAK